MITVDDGVQLTMEFTEATALVSQICLLWNRLKPAA